MGFYNNLCPGCMNEVGDAEKCPYCSFDLTAKQTAPYLPYGTLIAGKYVVGDILEQNSEGVTYLGLDTITNSCVRIREFLPVSLISRYEDDIKITVPEENKNKFNELRTAFLEMWHTVMKLRSLDCLITVLDVFEANDTAYAVAEADGSSTLSDYLENNGGIMKWDDITEKLFPVMDALEALAGNGVIHGNISPDTLFLCSNGKFKVWSFSINEARKTDTVLDADITEGYTAFEQYDGSSILSAACDVYGFITVLYRCLTGQIPVDSKLRAQNDLLAIPAVCVRELPEHVLTGFIGALQVYRENRTQNFASLKKAFSKDIYEMQRQADAEISSLSLIDPISELSYADVKPEKVSAPVIINPSGTIPVLNKQADDKKTKASSKTVVVMGISIVVVMLIFFTCLSLTGIITFNFGGGTTAKVVEIPDFTNYAKNDPFINQSAKELGLHIKLLETSNADIPQGYIFDQDIAAGTKAERGSTINLYYSKGGTTVTLPDFSGMTFTETVYYLGKLNLPYNIIEKDNDGSKTAGTVATMSPAANSVVYEGTEITIEVWGESGKNGSVVGENTGSEITSSSSILNSIFGRLSDSVSGLGNTIQNFMG